MSSETAMMTEQCRLQEWAHRLETASAARPT